MRPSHQATCTLMDKRAPACCALPASSPQWWCDTDDPLSSDLVCKRERSCPLAVVARMYVSERGTGVLPALHAVFTARPQRILLTARAGAARRSLVLFQQRKPMVNQDWNQKLPDFVQRLEEALYRTAASKEEYQNYSTLESRLQSVARKMVSRGASRPGDPNATAAAAAAATGTSFQQQQLTRQQQQVAQTQVRRQHGAFGVRRQTHRCAAALAVPANDRRATEGPPGDVCAAADAAGEQRRDGGGTIGGQHTGADGERGERADTAAGGAEHARAAAAGAGHTAGHTPGHAEHGRQGGGGHERTDDGRAARRRSGGAAARVHLQAAALAAAAQARVQVQFAGHMLCHAALHGGQAAGAARDAVSEPAVHIPAVRGCARPAAASHALRGGQVCHLHTRARVHAAPEGVRVSPHLSRLSCYPLPGSSVFLPPPTVPPTRCTI